MIKVGRKNPNHKNKKPYTYNDVKYDVDGWADCKQFLPNDYDLVYLKREGKQIISGWLTCNNWKGLRIKKGDKIIAWKRKPQDEENY